MGNNIQTFKSKIGLEILIPVSLLLGWVLYVAISNHIWVAVAFMVVLIASIVYLFLNTYYQVEGNILKIKRGFFKSIIIHISTIKKITETNNPETSPATSLDRLQIIYDKFKYVLVSPKDKLGFINYLKNIEPQIQVFYKKDKAK